ncbi:MAG: polysaccharide deacetylase family protein [bacterium]
MSGYTSSSLLFGMVLLTIILMVQYLGINPWWIAIPVALYLALLITGSAAIGMNFYFRSLNRSSTKEKKIALTFDDGPDGKVTEALMDLLEKYDAQAAFFCIGKNVMQFPEIVRKAVDKGHIIGNHSYTHHRWFDLFSAKRMAAEIKATNREIERATGKTPALFRPPYGVTNPSLKKAIQETGMIPVGWSLRSFDTLGNKEKILKKLRRKTKPGKVVLFHDRGPELLQLMEEYLRWLSEKDYKVVSLTELFNMEAYEVD